MKLLKYILLCFSIISCILCEDVEIIIVSNSFTIDTVEPEIELFSPSHGDSYGPQDNIEIIWNASDQSPAINPMTINVSANLDNPYFELFSEFENSGYLQLNVPDYINTLFASVRLDIVDYYGNTSSTYSSGYFIIGSPDISNYEVDHEDIYTEIVSSIFEIDTKKPIVSWIFPNQSSSFDPGQGQIVRWQAEDNNIADNPIDLFFIDATQDSYILENSLINNSAHFIHLPNISTQLGYFKVSAIDNYGNIGYDLSDEYMTIGDEFVIEIEEETLVDTLISQSFTIDTKPPEFNMISDASYFYPSGGETLTQYNSIPLDWNCSDDSYEHMNVVVSLAYLLGGWYTVIDTFPQQSIYSNAADLSFNGIVDNSIWGRLIFEAIDDYGNSTQQYNDDYFILGSSDGDIGAELYDEENLEMFVSWTWENKKHRIAIAPRALELLNVGDQIDIIDENGLVDNNCDTSTGPISLGSSIIQTGGPSNNNYINPIHMQLGVDHCLIGAGGGRMPGYIEGDSLRIRITTSADSSYYLRPLIYRGSLTFNNRNTIIKEFNTTPYQLNNINIDPFLVIDEREIDNFNVYSKVTNHTGGLNREITCDNDGVCDSSELVSDYNNESDCLTAGYQWDTNELLCYFDHNSSGDYSADEVDENVADCYSDCCSVQSEDDWCFIEMVTDEEFNHSLVSSNYLPANTSSASVSYKVYALDQNYNEIYQAVSEDAEITLGSDDISSISLGAGWNWFSLNRNISNMGVNSVFSQFLEDDWQCEYGGSDTNCPYYIKSQDAYGIFYSGYGFYPEFTMEIESFYKLQMNGESELWYGGSIVDPSLMPLSLNTGWNWVGYLTPDALSINSALSGIIDNNSPAYAKSQSGFAIFYEDFGFYPEFIMDVNGGYMLQMNSVDTLTYPSGALYSNNNFYSDINESTYWSVNYQDFEFSASTTIEIDMNHLQLSENDQVAVFNDDKCHGIAKAKICPINGKLLFSLMYYSNEEELQNLDIKYFNYINNQVYDIREKINFTSDENFGDIFSPIIIHDILVPIEYKLEDPYPNPFNPTASIDFQLPENVAHLQLSIYDLRGRLVETLHNGPMNYGYHKYKWNADNFSSGIYFVNMVTNKQKFTKKITLLK